jgi:hypothetical protein
MPWLNRLAAGNLPLSPCFDRRSARVGFMVDEVVVGHEVLRIISLFLVSVIPSMLHTPVHLHVALTKRTNCGSLGICQKTMVFQKSGGIG